MQRIFDGYERRKPAPSGSTSRTCSPRGPPVRRAPGGGRRGPRALPRVHGRRVPGREPAAAGAARRAGSATATTSASSATTTRRSTRSRRVAATTCSASRPLSRGARRAARGELPLDPAGARASRTAAPHLGGFDKELRPTRADGPNPTARASPTPKPRSRSSSTRSRRLHARASPEEIAVLYRINARSEPFEEAFAAAGIPYQVRDGSFLRRPGPRAVLRGSSGCRRGHRRRGRGRVTDALGFDADGEPDADEEVTLQADLARLRALAGEYDARPTAASSPAFVAELADGSPRSGAAGRAAADVPSRERPRVRCGVPARGCSMASCRSVQSAADPDEERRLLYVGITRARRHSPVGRATRRPAEPVPRRARRDRRRARTRRPRRPPAGRRSPFGRRPAVRPAQVVAPRARARADGVPAYVGFHDATLAAIAERKPSDERPARRPSRASALSKLERYADEVLGVVAAS